MLLVPLHAQQPFHSHAHADRRVEVLPVALPICVWMIRTFSADARGHGMEAVIRCESAVGLHGLACGARQGPLTFAPAL
jgi:hypothetical protein